MTRLTHTERVPIISEGAGRKLLILRAPGTPIGLTNKIKDLRRHILSGNNLKVTPKVTSVSPAGLLGAVSGDDGGMDAPRAIKRRV